MNIEIQSNTQPSAYDGLYQDVWKSLLHDMSDARRQARYWLNAPRAFGKTYLLRALHIQSEILNLKAVLVSCAAPSQFIDRLTRAPKWDVLLIDDLDALENNPQMVEVLEDKLSSCLLPEPGIHQHVIAASRAPRDIVLRRLQERYRDRFHSTSLVFGQLTPRPLNPWISLRLASPVQNPRVTFVNSWASKHCEGATRDEIKKWAEAIEVETGGHPALFWIMLVELPRTGSALRSVQDPEGYLHAATIQRVYYAVQPDLTELREKWPMSYDALLALARSEGTGLPIVDPNIYLPIMMSGLAYADPEKPRTLCIPGSLLRNWLASQPNAQADARTFSVRIAPDADTPATHGYVVVADPQGKEISRVSFDHRAWRVMQEMDKSGNERVSKKDLCSKLNMSADGLNAALKDVRKALREQGLERVLDTDWNQGYRYRLLRNFDSRPF